MSKLLITGGSGFFGSVLKTHLAGEGHPYVNFDLLEDPADAAAGRMHTGDLRRPGDIAACFERHGPFDAVLHVAAQLAHESSSPQMLWESNVDGTRHLLEEGKRRGIGRFLFTSTNCLWGKPVGKPVTVDEPPTPVETYGKSKLEAEKIIQSYRDDFATIIFRSSTIIAPGRVGLLGILFEFIDENRKVPVVGRERKVYQFVHALDYAQAIHLSLSHPESAVFHVGSDEPLSLEESYEYVIEKSGSKSRVYHLPKGPTLLAMKLAYQLGLSPLGPYHYGMIAEEFEFDTSGTKEALGWRPTKSNGEILYEAYRFYHDNQAKLAAGDPALSAHRRSAKMGVIRLLKWLS
ncbi:MAG: NAD-dependent epimerase/dehydratase family protein [Verrucomicrobiota bacterium]